jgi:hypothetical protein
MMGRKATYTIHDYMTIEALEDGLTAKLSLNACEYCVDGSLDWVSLPKNTETIAVNAGQTISFRATGLVPETNSAYRGIGTFTISKRCNLLGNCTAMAYGDDARFNTSVDRYFFARLFDGNSTIVSVSKKFLPSKTLGTRCCAYMFNNCTNLTSSPELPATSCGEGCYSYMFSGCTSLQATPILTATSSNGYIYSGMFYNCKSITKLPQMKFGCTGTQSYAQMFYGCDGLTSIDLTIDGSGSYLCSGMFESCKNLTSVNISWKLAQHEGIGKRMFANCTKLEDASNISLPTTYYGCYEMFYGCSSLKITPTFNSTTTGSYIYYGMFQGCTSLVVPPSLQATSLNSYCYANMFYGCSSLTSAPELPATTLSEGCYEAMFHGCTSLTIAPNLNATTLVTKCYQGMFGSCENLKYIYMLAKNASASNCLTNWVSGVSTTGTFVKHWEATWDVVGVNGVPTGWELKLDFTPVECTSLTITANDVSARATYTTITYTAIISGYDNNDNQAERTIIKTTKSDEFPQNTSYTDVVMHEISFTYMGVTATTTITQGVWKDQSYEIDLNNNWRLSSDVANPDSSMYDGVYESFSNRNVHNTAAIMYIDIVGYRTFKLYIRSNAESSYDYVMVSQLDKPIGNNTSYSDTTLVKANTRAIQNSGTSIRNYTLVEFTEIDENEHRITVVYRKDGSANSGTDSGYVLIPIS